MRRLAQAIIVLTLYSYPIGQLLCTLVNQSFYVINLSFLKVYKDNSEMKAEMISEITILITVYMLLMFSGEYVSDGETHNDIGMYMIGLTIASFVISGCFILKQIIASLRI